MTRHAYTVAPSRDGLILNTVMASDAWEAAKSYARCGWLERGDQITVTGNGEARVFAHDPKREHLITEIKQSGAS